MSTGAILTIVALVVTAGFVLLWSGYIIGQMSRKEPAKAARRPPAPEPKPAPKGPVKPTPAPRTTYQPPPPRPRGACGLRECRIMTPHSHVDALVKRLKETK